MASPAVIDQALILRTRTHLYRIEAAAAGLNSGVAGAETIHFDDVKPGALPAHWLGTVTGQGQPKWTVEQDESAPSGTQVLKQSGWAPNPGFPVCLKEDTSLTDGFVEVKFKPLAGTNDQSGGVVWRARDARNYYVCRANALEDNVVLYKVDQGKRRALDIVGRSGGYGQKVKVAPHQWHTLRVEFAGSHFEVIFDGQHRFEVEDRAFVELGHVGVWTKADSVTLFDDFFYGSQP